jgi:hypothetical protein
MCSTAKKPILQNKFDFESSGASFVAKRRALTKRTSAEYEATDGAPRIPRDVSEALFPLVPNDESPSKAQVQTPTNPNTRISKYANFNQTI